MDNNIRTACNSELTDESVSIVYKGRKIHFCEKECLDEFKEDPEGFLKSDHFLIEFNLLPKVVR